MIKTRLIASLVGGIIIFVWQFMSWSFLGIHTSEEKYHPQQEQIIQILRSANTEEGTYFIPGNPPGTSRDEQEKLYNSLEGQSMAMVTYIRSMDTSMARPMIRGFLLDFFLVYLLIYIFTRGGMPPFMRIVAASVSAGMFAWLWGPYMAHNWFQLPWPSILPQLIDNIVAWGLCGLWLGWYLTRSKNTVV